MLRAVLQQNRTSIIGGFGGARKASCYHGEMRTDNGLAKEAGAEGEMVCVFLFIEAQTILGMCRVKGNNAQTIRQTSVGLYVIWQTSFFLAVTTIPPCLSSQTCRG